MVPADPSNPPSRTDAERAPRLCFSSLGNRVVIAVGDTIHSMRMFGDCHTQHQLPGLDSLALVGTSELWAIAQGELRRFSLLGWTEKPPIRLHAGPAHSSDLLADAESHERTALLRQSPDSPDNVNNLLLVEHTAHELIVRLLDGPLPDGCLLRPAGGHRVLVAASGQICVHDTRTSTLSQMRVPVPGPIVAVELHLWGEWLMAFVATDDGIELVRLRADGTLEYRLLLPRFDHYSFDHDTCTLAIHSADEHTIGMLVAGAEPVARMHELAAPFPVYAMHLGQSGRELHLFRRLPGVTDDEAGGAAMSSYWRTSNAQRFGIDGLLIEPSELEQRGHTRLLRRPGPKLAVPAAAPLSLSGASASPAERLLNGSLAPYLRHHLAHGSLPTLRGLDGSSSGFRSDLALRSTETSTPSYDKPNLHVHDLLHLAVHNAAWVIAQDWHDGHLAIPDSELEAAKDLIEEAVGLPLLDAPQLIKLIDSACAAFFERIHAKVEGSLLRGIILPFVDLCEEFNLPDRDANLLLTVVAVELSPVFRRLIELAARGLGLAASNEAVLRYIALGDELDDPSATELAPGSPLRRFGLVQVMPTIDRGQLLVADPVIIARLRGEPCTGSGVEACTKLVQGVPPLVDLATVSLSSLHALVEALAEPRADGSMHRVVLVGAAGSGRYRLAAALAARGRHALAVIDCAALARQAADTADALRMTMLRAKMRGALPCLRGLDDLAVHADASALLSALIPVIREHPGAVFVCTRLLGDDMAPSQSQALNSLVQDAQVIVMGPGTSLDELCQH